ncbi:DUF2066 domain-containing protein [Wenzhouxiangella sp. XN201]|uniref:DUF2066 domain-containing protein n=1 Tax=Wenzhouxiangella sp. XN201 TaxID=2710755 RepID=UPI001F09ED8D|nr:DUF2066 domain-containing protein [Wenzhouxiangella sp. XN201]
MIRLLFISLTLATALTAQPVCATPLYVGEVAIERQPGSAGDRLAALDQVLARLTGRFEGSLVRELGLGPEDLDELVLSQQLAERSVVTPSGESEEELRLEVEFDEPTINELLRRNQLPRWGRERSAVLLWMAIEDEAGARFVESPHLEYLVLEHARRVGLDVIRPLSDALDLAEVTLADVRGGFLGSAEASAQRYGASVIAMLDLRRRGDDDDAVLWNARWRWRVEGQDAGLDRSGEDVEALIRAGLQRLSSQLAGRYGVLDTDGAPTRWLIGVDGIVDEVQYAEVLRHLDNLSVVENVRVVSAVEREVVFEVLARGERIERYLTMGGLLVPRQGRTGNRLDFRLAR